jgi:hypothetical protein
MKRILFVCAVAACAPASTSRPMYTSPQPVATSRPQTLAVRGRIPRGQRIDHIVVVQIDRQGRRQRIRVRPAADGTYAVQLPPGHSYAMAYEAQGRLVGNVSFPRGGGRSSQVLNVSQNVTVNQYVDLGDTTYVDGVYLAAHDPDEFMDSDGDGTVDAQDPDDVDEDVVAIDAGAFDGEFEDIDDGSVD